MKDLVMAARAFADPTRVRILRALDDRELCVCELCDALQVTQSTLSTHLQVIREAELISARRQGKWMYYSIAPQARRLMEPFFGFFSGSLKANPTLRRDARTLKKRLSMRANGACCVGFGNSKCSP